MKKAAAREEAHSMWDVNDPKFIAFVALYWAEGNKSKGPLGIANTDPDMMSVMLGWFKKFSPKAKLTCRVRYYPDNDIDEVMGKWESILGTNNISFKSITDVDKRAGKKPSKSKYGICYVSFSGWALREYLSVWIELLRTYLR